MQLAAEAWNTIVKDEESLVCSDSLKSVVSSLRPMIDIVVPGAEQSSGEFGAQATSFLDSQDDADAVVLSVGTLHDAEGHAPDPAPASTRASLASASRKRSLESTPEATKARTSKRVMRSSRASTPRLRHDNSQIQFEPVASSSPAVEESQHLTERQKEIRKRQKQNAAMYPGIQSSSPTKAAGTSVGQAKAETTSNDGQQEATPERGPSYGELISSTPTPRRGQVILMDGDNDPPSSPPEPRPYPLLSEIRSRSRNSSLENWDFSSPPGSPVTSRQQVTEDIEPSHVALTDDSTQARVASQSDGRKTRSSKKHSPSPDVVPSSLPETPSRRVSNRTSRQARSGVPKTPQRNHRPISTTAETTPKSAEEEFVDARSSPERSSPALPEIPTEDPPAKDDTSFALSEGDESQFMKFFVELESRKCNLPMDKFSSPRQPASEEVMECITVHTDTSSPAKEVVDMSDPEDPAQDLIPSTPAESVEDDSKGSQAGKKKKRKRGAAKSSDERRKKRRSLDPDVDWSQATEYSSSSMPASQEANSKPASAVKTRRSARKQQQKHQVTVLESQEAEASPAESKEERDTDEEVMSQLMTESQEASQTRGAPMGHDAEALSTIEDSMDIGSTNERAQERGAESVEEKETAVNGVDSILEKLRGGLDGLRNASLSRAEVYQIEDMLMDMKRELFEAERRGRRSV